MWRATTTPGSPSTEPNVTPCTSSPTTPASVVPHVPQNAMPQGPCTLKIVSASRVIHENEPGWTSAYAEPEPLNALRHREQWQQRASRSGASTR